MPLICLSVPSAALRSKSMARLTSDSRVKHDGPISVASPHFLRNAANASTTRLISSGEAVPPTIVDGRWQTLWQV